MSYTPTNWKDGDVITSQRLNKIENGIIDIENNSILEEHFDFIIKNKPGDHSEPNDFIVDIFPEYQDVIEAYQQNKKCYARIYNENKNNFLGECVISITQNEQSPRKNCHFDLFNYKITNPNDTSLVLTLLSFDYVGYPADWVCYNITKTFS